MTSLQKLLYLGLAFISVESNPKTCDRRRSRLVTKVVYEKLMPAFTAVSADLSSECVFSPANSPYQVQENHKSSEEGGSRWYCHFCGKAFYTEHFLDVHYDNRHADQLGEENTLCLADVCEVFRCDVIGNDIIPDFWDFALCLEDDMKSLYHKCELMVQSCVPSGLTQNETRWLTEITKQELCSYLTCSKYWDIPFPSTNMDGTTGLYIIMTVMIILGLLVYYCLFYAYFYTDSFSDSIAYDPTPRTRHTIRPYQPTVRHRQPLVPPD